MKKLTLSLIVFSSLTAHALDTAVDKTIKLACGVAVAYATLKVVDVALVECTHHGYAQLNTILDGVPWVPADRHDYEELLKLRHILVAAKEGVAMHDAVTKYDPFPYARGKELSRVAESTLTRVNNLQKLWAVAAMVR